MNLPVMREYVNEKNDDKKKILDTLTRILYIINMKALTVAEIKTNFSDVLVRVKNGEKVKILYGKSKKPVAMIVPIENINTPREIGVLDGKAKFMSNGSSKISEEEFLGV
jgi:antitoxin (DNA-binding transcriptional repressor) of toxin-antitoxin stability system